jgi:hypothetical protein
MEFLMSRLGFVVNSKLGPSVSIDTSYVKGVTEPECEDIVVAYR